MTRTVTRLALAKAQPRLSLGVEFFQNLTNITQAFSLDTNWYIQIYICCMQINLHSGKYIVEHTNYIFREPENYTNH